MFCFALRGSKHIFLFVITVADVVPCVGCKTSPGLIYSAGYTLLSVLYDHRRYSENSEISIVLETAFTYFEPIMDLCWSVDRLHFNVLN